MGDLEAKKSRRFAWPLALLALAALNCLLYGPLFSPLERPYRGSIAAGYAGTARFVSEHPNPWGWNPQQYAGQPTQFSYPPLIPYSSALLVWLTGIEALWAYRLVVGLMACLGPVTLALAFAWATGSRFWAIALGVGYTLLSPSYGLFDALDTDRGLYYLPWRLLVLMKYGEGPHVTGLTLLPLVLAALVWGARRKDFTSLFLMSLALASAPLLNWLCAFALTVLVLLLIATDYKLAPRILLAGLWGYALSCFWLTPDYVYTTLFNWPKDAYGYKVEQSHLPMYGGLLALLALSRWLLQRAQAPFGVTFSTLAALTYCWIVAAFYLFNRDTLPESRRYAVEFELFLMSAIAAWMAWGIRSREWVDRLCVILCLAVCLRAATPQLKASAKRRWSDWGFVERANTIEYKLASWMDRHRPQGRVFASGSLRFRLNAISPLHQIGGTFESGLRNRIAVNYHYQVRTGEDSKPGQDGQDAFHELSVLGAEYFVAHGLESEEYYRDIKNPAKLAPFAPVVYQATPHDSISRLPFRSLAHLVRPEELPDSIYKEALPRLAAATQDASRPLLRSIEEHPGRYRIEGPIRPGDLVFFSMNFDPGWQATQDGRPIPIEPNALGLINLKPTPASMASITLEYKGTAQQKLFAGLSALAWLGSLLLLRRQRL